MEGEENSPLAFRPTARGPSLPCATQGLVRAPECSKFQRDPKESELRQRETISFSLKLNGIGEEKPRDHLSISQEETCGKNKTDNQNKQ